MSLDPVRKYLRPDRILSYEEFERIRPYVIPRGKRRKKRLYLLRRFSFPMTLTYRTFTSLGIILLFGTVLLYGILSTCVVKKQYERMNQDTATSNLALNLNKVKLTNERKVAEIKFDEKQALGLGLMPKEKTYIIRTNIEPEKWKASTVKELYPLADEILMVEP